tara:strand:- start:448 stop:708 length:261 start_codon:yes stop_codon:yes gene_type:complete
MNYYIVTDEVFNTLTKGNISFMLKSIDTSKRIVITSDEVSNNLHTFVNTTALSEYTITNTSDWVGDGNGVEEITFDEIKYIPEIDD